MIFLVDKSTFQLNSEIEIEEFSTSDEMEAEISANNENEGMLNRYKQLYNYFCLGERMHEIHDDEDTDEIDFDQPLSSENNVSISDDRNHDTPASPISSGSPSPLSPASPIQSKGYDIILFFLSLLGKWSSFYKISDNRLLKILKFFLIILSKLFNSLTPIIKLFPSSIHLMNKACKISTESFSKLVVCPLCHSLYKFHDCFNEVGGKRIPRTC